MDDEWPELWDDGFPFEFSNQDCRAEVRHRTIIGTATSHWNKKHRNEAANRGWALPGGEFPIKDKEDWYKARQALGRAKNRAKVLRHLKKRAQALKIPKSEWEHLK